MSLISHTNKYKLNSPASTGKISDRIHALRNFIAKNQNREATQNTLVNEIISLGLAFSQGKATRLAQTIIGVSIGDMIKCRSQINATPAQTGIPLVTAEQVTLLLPSTRNPQLDALTRSCANSLAADSQVAQAAGVDPQTLVFLADQRVEVSILSDGMTGLQQGADQHVTVYDAAEKELTDTLYAYYDQQKASGTLTPAQEQTLDEDFDELLKIRAKASDTKQKTKKNNAKIDAANEKEILAAQNEAFVEQVKDQIRDGAPIAPADLETAATLYADQLNNGGNAASPAPEKAARALIGARRRGISRRLH